MNNAQTPMTVSGLKTWARKNRPLVKAVLVAQAMAQVEKERVSAYTTPIFKTFEFFAEDGSRIENDDLLYHCEDEEKCAAYYAALDAAHNAHSDGFDWEGKCPALVAKGLAMEAERELVKSAGAFAGVGDKAQTKWDEFLKWALEVCLNELV